MRKRTFLIQGLAVLLTFPGLAACGDATATPVLTATTVAATTAPQATTTVVTTAPKSGTGQELVGQSDEKAGLKATVTKVESFTEATNTFRKQTFKPKNGLFLVVYFDLQNSGSAQTLFSSAQLNDSKGRTFDFADFEAGFAFYPQIKSFTPNSQVEAGKTSQDFKVFDVSDDATGLKFKLT